MPTGIPDAEVLDRYLAGHAERAEVDAVTGWVNANPQHAAALDHLRRMTTAAPHRWNVESEWADLQQRLAAPARAVPLQSESRPRLHVWGAHTLRYAAVALVAVSAGLFWQRFGLTGRPAAAIPIREITTAPSQRATIQLVDGSRITLGVASTLRYPMHDGAATRDVYLDGEAYFEVAHHAQSPFVVHARNSATTVLGTAFAVRAYATDTAVQVVVESGRVALAARANENREARVSETASPRAQFSGAAVVLAAGDVGRLTSTGSSAVVRNADIGALLAWRNGKLVFKGVPLHAVLIELERSYDVDFVVDDPALLSQWLTASFPGESLTTETLDLLALSLHARYTRDGRKVTFYR